jgi:hemerythrin-like domain-containing protein
MDRPTEHLIEDHQVAARGVRCLTAMADGLRRGGAFPADDVATALRFLREWVVAVHMRKEDDLVGPAVAMRGDDRAAELVGSLFRLREEIDELLHSLVLFWEPLGTLTEQEQQGFLAAVEALVQRLKRRQQLEEEELFPACNRFVGADDQLHWIPAFRELEVERGRRDDWSGQIDALANRWLGGACE